MASLTRINNAQVIVLRVINEQDTEGLKQLRDLARQALRERTQQLLADIRYQFITKTGSIPEEIIRNRN